MRDLAIFTVGLLLGITLVLLVTPLLGSKSDEKLRDAAFECVRDGIKMGPMFADTIAKACIEMAEGIYSKRSGSEAAKWATPPESKPVKPRRP